MARLGALFEGSALACTLASLTLCSFADAAHAYAPQDKRALFASLEVLEALQELVLPDWAPFVGASFFFYFFSPCAHWIVLLGVAPFTFLFGSTRSSLLDTTEKVGKWGGVGFG